MDDEVDVSWAELFDRGAEYGVERADVERALASRRGGGSGSGSEGED